MLTIRLQRTGRKNLASYRIVLAEKTSAAKGKFKEILGHFLPQRDPNVFEFKEDRIRHWLKNGAQMSNTTARLLTRAGVQGLEHFILRYTKQRKKSEMKAENASTNTPLNERPPEASPLPSPTPP